MQKSIQARHVNYQIRAGHSNQFRPTHSHLATSPRRPGPELPGHLGEARAHRRELRTARAALSDAGWPLALAAVKTYPHRSDRLILE